MEHTAHIELWRISVRVSSSLIAVQLSPDQPSSDESIINTARGMLKHTHGIWPAIGRDRFLASLYPLTTNRTCRNFGLCVSVPSPFFGCQNPLVRATNYCDQFGLSVPVFRSQTVSWNSIATCEASLFSS